MVNDINLHCTQNSETPEKMIIGQRVRQIFDTKPRTCTVEWFARSLDCKRRNIYRIFERDNIDIRMLARIGDILQHDFFADISAGIVAVRQLPTQIID